MYKLDVWVLVKLVSLSRCSVDKNDRKFKSGAIFVLQRRAVRPFGFVSLPARQKFGFALKSSKTNSGVASSCSWSWVASLQGCLLVKDRFFSRWGFGFFFASIPPPPTLTPTSRPCSWLLIFWSIFAPFCFFPRSQHKLITNPLDVVLNPSTPDLPRPRSWPLCPRGTKNVTLQGRTCSEAPLPPPAAAAAAASCHLYHSHFLWAHRNLSSRKTWSWRHMILPAPPPPHPPQKFLSEVDLLVVVFFKPVWRMLIVRHTKLSTTFLDGIIKIFVT